MTGAICTINSWRPWSTHPSLRSARPPWGELYEVEIRVEGLNAEVRPVTTVWLVAGEDEPPTLVTAYVGGASVSA